MALCTLSAIGCVKHFNAVLDVLDAILNSSNIGVVFLAKETAFVVGVVDLAIVDRELRSLHTGSRISLTCNVEIEVVPALVALFLVEGMRVAAIQPRGSDCQRGGILVVALLFF